jgi:hypothetical protein
MVSPEQVGSQPSGLFVFRRSDSIQTIHRLHRALSGRDPRLTYAWRYAWVRYDDDLSLDRLLRWQFCSSAPRCSVRGTHGRGFSSMEVRSGPALPSEGARTLKTATITHTEVTTMYTCPQCGQGNRQEARFCRHCGADMRPTRQPGNPFPHRVSRTRPPGHRTAVRLRDWVQTR